MTSAAVQKQLGYYEPNYGTLFADREASNGEQIPKDRLLRPRAEAEIAFVLSRDLNGEALTIAQVMSALEYAVCAIEIIDSRIADWDIRATDAIADNASCGMYVLGSRPRRITEVDLTLCGMVSRLNGLACAVAAIGQPLKEADIVLSGALGPIVPLSTGDLFETEIDGFGSVRVALTRSDG
jgi:2-keto-4-pentenoate hydratase